MFSCFWYQTDSIGCAARLIHACAKLNYLQDHKEVLGMHVHSCVKQAFGTNVAQLLGDKIF